MSPSAGSQFGQSPQAGAPATVKTEDVAADDDDDFDN